MTTLFSSYSLSSAAQLLTLFSANSSSPASSSKSSSASNGASNSQPPLTNASKASANDPITAIKAILAEASGTNTPANTIKAILAQAQVAPAPLETSPEKSASLATAQAAYAPQTSSVGVDNTHVNITGSGQSLVEFDDDSIVQEAFDTQGGYDGGGSALVTVSNDDYWASSRTLALSQTSTEVEKSTSQWSNTIAVSVVSQPDATSQTNISTEGSAITITGRASGAGY